MTMRLRQEQLVLIAALGVVAAGFLGGPGSARASRDRAGASEAVLPRFLAPAWPQAGKGVPDSAASNGSAGGSAGRSAAQGSPGDVTSLVQRALFSPPRDTRPLDPLIFEAPPLPPLRRLAPPGENGPAVAHFARYLGRNVVAVVSNEAPSATDAESAAAPAELQSPFAGATSFSGLDPTERLEAQNAFKGQYDWLRTESELLFGQIVDGDRFGLLLQSREADPVRFVQIDPFSGLQRFPGQGPIPYDRSRIVEFGFADTPGNQLEVRFRALPDPLTPATYAQALDLAAEALALRLSVPRGPAIAESLYRRATQVRPEDARPQIGLARTLKAAHDYAGALSECERLCERYPAEADTWVALGELQAQFLDWQAAEASFERAIKVERSSSEAHLALGRLLFEQRRYQEARSAFSQAVTHAPAAIEAQAERLAARLWSARAALAVGDLSAARAEFASVLAADPQAVSAQAGALECDRLLAGQTPTSSIAALGDPASSGRELALVRGLWLLDRGQLAAARVELDNALAADPLQAARPLAALSHLADLAGQESEALDLVSRALLADPQDAWVLYQRGRLLRLRQDFAGARAHLEAALARESDFEDALAELGELSLETEDYESATRYFERAEELAAARSASRPDLVARRGFARLFDQAYRDARALFQRALELEATRFEARAGLAWCEYRLGDVEEGLIQLRGLDDARRDQGDGDPLRRWALAQIARVEDHRSKDIWSDRFEYTRLGNGWQVDEAAGPTASLSQGKLLLQGNFRQSGQVRFWREYAASEFVALEADVTIAASSTVRAGLFVAREVARPSGVQLQAMAALARNRDGTSQVMAMDAARGEESWIDLSKADFAFPTGRKVHVRIERVTSGKNETVNVLMDGVPVLVGRDLSSLGRGNAPLKVGVFAEGETGRQLELSLDDVEVTRKIR
jgi:tetratricopeptide (TPR) repeat protein